MTEPNYIYEKGTILVSQGGGGSFMPLAPGEDGQVLGADPSSELGVGWGEGSASGNVVGPGSATAHHFASYADTTGELLEDSGYNATSFAQGPGTSVAHRLAAFTNTDGQTLEDSGYTVAQVAKGPGSSTTHHLAAFANTGGELLEDAGYAVSQLAKGPGSSVAHNLASYADTAGELLEDSLIAVANVVQGPASTVDNTIPRYDSTTGKLLQSSGVTLSDTAVQLFPAGGGPSLTAGAGAAERKGSFTFNGSGTHTKILTTAVVTGTVISYTYVTLGTVTAAQSVLTTIDTGVGFTPVSAANNDSSVVNWAIVG